MENWKPIFDTRYEVSDLGRIRHKKTGRIRSTEFPSFKYNLINVWSGSGYKQHLVHRIVADAFFEKRDGCDFVNHINGNKRDNRASNLEWCTRQENEDHAYRMGLKNSTGSNNTMSKLTENDVKNIKSMFTNHSDSDIADKFGVHRVTINRIRNKKIWDHI